MLVILNEVIEQGVVLVAGVFRQKFFIDIYKI